VLATLLLTGAYLATHLSLNLLCRATAVAGRMSFKQIVLLTLGPRYVLALQVAVILNNMGGLVVYLIIVGDVLVGAKKETGLLEPLGEPFTNRFFAVGMTVLLCVGPLCLLRRIESLKYTSAASMVLSFVFVLITFSLLTGRVAAGEVGAVNWFPATDASLTDKLRTLPMFVTAYVCHYNMHPVRCAAARKRALPELTPPRGCSDIRRNGGAHRAAHEAGGAQRAVAHHVNLLAGGHVSIPHVHHLHRA
jgi:sodium-coupled neutral amino acid transporter 2